MFAIFTVAYFASCPGNVNQANSFYSMTLQKSLLINIDVKAQFVLCLQPVLNPRSYDVKAH